MNLFRWRGNGLHEQSEQGVKPNMSQQIISEVTKDHLRTDLPDFRPGDRVRVSVNIKEGARERVQDFDGLVIKRQGAGVSETFTVRKTSFGVGIERTFPVHTPSIKKIEVLRKGKVRRAKLNYIRGRSAKASRIKERR